MQSSTRPISLTSLQPENQAQPARRPDNLRVSTQVDPYVNTSAAQTHFGTGTSCAPPTAGVLSSGPAPHQWLPQQAQHSYAGPTWDTVNSNTSGMPRVSTREADKEPWRYKGYRAMCTWMASDDDFFMIRKFEGIGARVVLLMQNRIVQLERELHEQDRSCALDGGSNGTFDFDQRKRRTEIMDELAQRLERYQRFVLDHSQIKARPRAEKKQISYIKNWLTNNNWPIRAQEVSFVDQGGDLMPMVPRIKPPLRRWIDKFDVLRRLPCWRVGSDKLDTHHYNYHDNFDSKTTIYSNEELIDKFVTCITVGLGLVMLIAPLWLLQYVYIAEPDMKARLKIITGFLVGFTILLSIVAVARPFEVLAATAAYGAVLMVFMQLGNSGVGGAGDSRR